MDYIVREKCSEIRALARMSLRHNWHKAALAVALFYILLNILPELIGMLIPGASYSYYDELLGETFTVSYVPGIYLALLGSVYGFGMYSYLISFVRRGEMRIAHLFDGFRHIFKAIWMSIVIAFFIFLWTLLFIIPGIIAAFRYSQAYIVLADHPEYSVRECMAYSKKYMKQNKGKYFCLGLTFIGWALLSAIPAAFIPLSLSGIPLLVVELIAAIPTYYFMAYMFTAQTVFYELVSGNLVAAPKAAPKDEFEF